MRVSKSPFPGANDRIDAIRAVRRLERWQRLLWFQGGRQAGEQRFENRMWSFRFERPLECGKNEMRTPYSVPVDALHHSEWEEADDRLTGEIVKGVLT